MPTFPEFKLESLPPARIFPAGYVMYTSDGAVEAKGDFWVPSTNPRPVNLGVYASLAALEIARPAAQNSGSTATTSDAGPVYSNGSAWVAVGSATPALELVDGADTTINTEVEGEAAVEIRRDIAPVWTASWRWSAAEVRLYLNETGLAADTGLWELNLNDGQVTLRTRTDANGAGQNVFYATDRTGTTCARFVIIPAVELGGPLTTGGNLTSTGHIIGSNVGYGLKLKEGSNATMGLATLVAGSVVVSTTAVTANSRIQLTAQADGGTPGFVRVSTRTGGTSFTVTSSNGADTSTVAWMIVEPS